MTTNTNTFIDTAKVMAKGQITIPKDIRNLLGVDSGSKVIFVVEDGNVRMVNAAMYAMQMMQEAMKGEREKSGLLTEEDVNRLVKEIRDEGD
ncbi:AbrB/MazE/SpoVT family DNA-binding domain-containing protein [uncultured Megasphaera sp.]|uniref:AbrB/MazE/SpoVT family DNA-binding domain-containing protein n=1 Tax=uncultured Megasphaera sp. TaxID=165188 RepID=UPI00261E27FC|nr:AbrB/MazE/SpoVT family DNA-binding domain-containing protein [uncultured Megasphaera sp.]